MDKISDIKIKYFTTFSFNKFESKILEMKIKERWVVDKSNIYSLVKIFDLNSKNDNISNKYRIKRTVIYKSETSSLSFKLFMW